MLTLLVDRDEVVRRLETMAADSLGVDPDLIAVYHHRANRHAPLH